MRTIYELYEWNLKMRKVHEHGFELSDNYSYTTRFGGNSFAVAKDDNSTGIRIGLTGSNTLIIEKIIDSFNHVIEYSLSFEEAKNKSIAYYDIEVAKIVENI